MNKYHATNRNRWNIGSPQWAAMHDQRGTWRIAHQQPEAVFVAQELELLGDIAGLSAAVLGSGDNLAVFALAGMGARVTSVDISSGQLEVAGRRAAELGLDVTFVEADVTDLRAYYREALRILRSDGLLLVNEYHPFRRVWKDLGTTLEVGLRYFDNSPREYQASEHVIGDRPGEVEQYEFHWTVAQYLNAVIEQGAELVKFEEIGDAAEGWEYAPMDGLPQMLLIAGRKL
jgi:SAM-dependent methyltransferase